MEEIFNTKYTALPRLIILKIMKIVSIHINKLIKNYM